MCMSYYAHGKRFWLLITLNFVFFFEVVYIILSFYVLLASFNNIIEISWRSLPLDRNNINIYVAKQI